MDQATEDIIRAHKEWGEAFRSGDVAQTMAFLTPDAVLIPPNEPARKGAEEIEPWARGFLEAVTVQEIDIAVDSVRVAGDWAVSHGRWHMTLEVGGNVMSDTTRYVVIWERQSDGAWKVVHDVWNGGLPASPGD
jgi:uncharacterized protein (TIGR02246 family)